MKRIIALFSLLVFTACQGPPIPTHVFAKAVAPNKTSITVANPSAVNGHDVIESLREWNEIAGWRLFDAYPVNDKYGFENADVRFEARTPICNPAGCHVHRAAMSVALVPNSDGTINHCLIFYDPTVIHGLYAHPDYVSHELAHCLGFIRGDGSTPENAAIDSNGDCSMAYKGVASYCLKFEGMNLPWQKHDLEWWGTMDQQMLDEAGYSFG